MIYDTYFIWYLLYCDVTEEKKKKPRMLMKLSIPSDMLYLHSRSFVLSEGHLEGFASVTFDDISLCHWLYEVTSGKLIFYLNWI